MAEGACYWNRKNYVEGQRAPRLGGGGGGLYVLLERIGPRASAIGNGVVCRSTCTQVPVCSEGLPRHHWLSPRGSHLWRFSS